MDQGGRSLLTHLEAGDWLELYCEECSTGIYRTTLCVTLSQPQ